MNNPSHTSEKLDINYAANAMLALTVLFLGYVAWFGLSYGSISADTYYTRISLIGLALAILYVGLQIGRIAGKIGKAN